MKNSSPKSQTITTLSKKTPIVVCSDRTEQQVAICAQLALDFDDVTACSIKQLPERIYSQPDSVLVLSWSKPCGELAYLIEFAEQKQLPLLVLTQSLNADQANLLPDTYGYVLLPSQVEPSFYGWLEYACRLRSRRQELDHMIEKLHQQIDDRKYVDQAKGLLMKHHKMDEQQAYKALRTAAMQNSQSLGQVAKTLIAALKV
ncbi:MAG: ANTAR domain-containing response regulator [Vibrio sp.]